MGASDSKAKAAENVTYDMWGNVYKSDDQLETEALRRYNMRVNAYNHLHHGSYFVYLEWCKSQYYLDCMPPSCTRGSGYRPRYDNFGSQYY